MKKSVKKKNVKKKVVRKRKKGINKGRSKQYTFELSEVIVVAILSILFGGIIGGLLTISKNYKYDSDIEEFYSVYDDLTNNYYKKVKKDELVDAAIEGMINYLGDPYSTYMDTDETESFNNTVNGEYHGVGITVGMVSDKPIVISVFSNSAASKAGIKVGDIIVKVDQKSVQGKSLDDVVSMIKDKKNVSLTISRGEKEYHFELKLSDVTIPSVSSKIIDRDDKKIGIIYTSIFAANTYSQFKKELLRLEKDGIESLIIDVRDNPGGHLDQVSKVLSLFLEKKKVIYQIRSNGKNTKYYSITSEKRNYPIVVLINEGSASASEILAGAMKESYQATIVGVTSYGKGTVQKEYSLSSGSSIKYTIEEWLTPKGNSINKKGIKPDIEVKLGDEYKTNPLDANDNQLQSAIAVLIK